MGGGPGGGWAAGAKRGGSQPFACSLGVPCSVVFSPLQGWDRGEVTPHCQGRYQSTGPVCANGKRTPFPRADSALCRQVGLVASLTTEDWRGSLASPSCGREVRGEGTQSGWRVSIPAALRRW